ncbi:acyltransferase family protein [Fodinibius sp.]|uniref:acyltransferase family protein n=1 Tax=Fodinibius sp. TaxID=1872440 RepID=UPI00356803B8
MNFLGLGSSKKKNTSAGVKKSKRLLSIDALRGFDMLLISGGALFIRRMEGKTEWGWVDWVATQMTHPAWHGFTFYDFIFPLFLFIAGVSLPFSLNKGLSTGMGKPLLYRKMFRRMLILIGLGILYKNAPVSIFEPSGIRYVSVLGRIGIAVFITTFLYLNFSKKGRMIWIGSILLLYYAALFLIPVPGHGAGDLSLEGNLVGWIDRQLLPGRLLQGSYDELGLLTQLPALCLTVLGSFAGDILRSNREDGMKLQWLFMAGVACVGIGLVWSLHFPVNKHLWSSSFILLTGGMAFLFMFGFYALIDVLEYKKWAFFFQVIGLNSLTIYLGYRFIDFSETSHLLFAGIYSIAPEPWHGVLQAFGAMMLVWLLLYFLYKKKIFIKV